jgi:hypothetical protein
MSELGQLMQEPAGGHNHGRRASTNPAVEGRNLPLGADEWQASEFLRSGGWTVARVKDPTAAGMAGHGGILHPAEYVDPDALRVLVERELGFTYEQVRSVYRQGRLSADQRELRGSIDARLLALSRAGGNMTALGRALGFYIDDHGNCDAIKAAVARAKEAS